MGVLEDWPVNVPTVAPNNCQPPPVLVIVKTQEPPVATVAYQRPPGLLVPLPTVAATVKDALPHPLVKARDRVVPSLGSYPPVPTTTNPALTETVTEHVVLKVHDSFTSASVGVQVGEPPPVTTGEYVGICPSCANAPVVRSA